MSSAAHIASLLEIGGNSTWSPSMKRQRDAVWSRFFRYLHLVAQPVGEFERLVPTLGKGKAIVAIARKLLVVVWHVLTHQAVDRHADQLMLTRELQRWGASHSLANQQGLSSGAFARQLLDRLGLGTSAASGAPCAAEGGEMRPLTAARVS